MSQSLFPPCFCSLYSFASPESISKCKNTISGGAKTVDSDGKWGGQDTHRHRNSPTKYQTIKKQKGVGGNATLYTANVECGKVDLKK